MKRRVVPATSQPRSSWWTRAWKLASRLEPDELEALERRIRQRRRELARPAPGYTDREVLEEVTEGAVTYQLERGRTHRGKSWYAYFWRRGKVVAELIGKDFRRLSQKRGRAA